MDRLQAYIINGTPASDLDTYLESDLSGNPAFLFSDTLQTGYAFVNTVTDADSLASAIINIDDYGLECDNDFKYVRDRKKALVKDFGASLIIATQQAPPVSPNSGDNYGVAAGATGDWATHDGKLAIYNGATWDFVAVDPNKTLEETAGMQALLDPAVDAEAKTICASNLIGTLGQQITAFGGDFNAKAIAQSRYGALVQECRYYRYLWAEKGSILQQIPSNAYDALGKITGGIPNDDTAPKNLHKLYYDQGIDGTDYGDGIEAISNWVYGTGGWAGIGLKDESWITILGQNMAAYHLVIGDILFNKGLTKAQIEAVKSWIE